MGSPWIDALRVPGQAVTGTVDPGGGEAWPAAVAHRPRDGRARAADVYPRPKRVRAWVRFGPDAVRVDAKLVSSTPLAAGIEFRAGEQTFRCWVWGNAVQLDDANA